MGIIGKKLRGLKGGRVAFLCPGCGEFHQVGVVKDKNKPGPLWGYNQNPDSPTFNPSILVRGVKLTLSDKELDRILDQYKLPEDRERMLADKRINTVCHSFIKDGFIQFLNDCTHELAGKTVELPTLTEESV